MTGKGKGVRNGGQRDPRRVRSAGVKDYFPRPLHLGGAPAVVTKFYVKPSTILTHYDAKIMVSHVATDQL